MKKILLELILKHMNVLKIQFGYYQMESLCKKYMEEKESSFMIKNQHGVLNAVSYLLIVYILFHLRAKMSIHYIRMNYRGV